MRYLLDKKPCLIYAAVVVVAAVGLEDSPYQAASQKEVGLRGQCVARSLPQLLNLPQAIAVSRARRADKLSPADHALALVPARQVRHARSLAAAAENPCVQKRSMADAHNRRTSFHSPCAAAAGFGPAGRVRTARAYTRPYPLGRPFREGHHFVR